MASDDPSGGRPASPIVLRIKLRYDDLEAMVQRFAANVGKSGLFLPTRSMQPIGAEVKFELRLADDTPALVGLGRVKAARPPDPHHPKAAFGMAVELMRVTPQSRALILRMLERRRELGFPELGLPTAADIDAARRVEPEAGRDVASGPVAVMTPPVAPAPPVARVAPVAAAPVGEGLLTAPRRTTGSIAVAKVAAIAPLSPEPPRRPRAAVSEILERASGPVAGLAPAVPGLDDDIDLATAIARARALAGSALDAELEALCEVAAAPFEISVEAASAELARQLGGSAVRRDRSAGWALPPEASVEPPGDAGAPSGAATHAATAAGEDAGPATATAPAVEDGAAVAAAAIEDGAAVAAVAVEEAAAVAVAALEDAGPVAVAALEDVAPVTEPAAEDAAPVAAPAAEAAAPVAEAAAPVAEDAAPVAEAAAPVTAAGPEHDAASIRPASLEDAGAPVAAAGDAATFASSDAAREADVQDHELAQRAELALADLDSDEHTELGGVPAPAGGFELPIEPDDLVPDLAPGLAPDDAALAGGFAPAIEPPLELGVDEFDDFEIIAEADADDEDLLASHGEQDASSRRGVAPRPATGERRPSELDFAARLDLGDDSDLHLGPSADEISAGRVIDSLQDELTGQHPGRHERFARRLPDPHAISAGAALAALEADGEADDDAGDETDGFDDSEVTDDPDAYAHRVVRPIFDPDPSSSFTLAGIPSDSIDVDLPSPQRPEPAALEPPRPARRSEPIEPPRPERRHAPLSLHEAPVQDFELEHALEALDVDLDDLAIPHAATQSQPERSRPTPQLRPPAASHTPAGVRAPAPDPRAAPRAPQPTPASAPRAPQPTPAPPRRAPQPTPAPPRVAAPTPSRAVRPIGGAPGPGRIAPRLPSEGVDIDFDDDD